MNYGTCQPPRPFTVVVLKDGHVVGHVPKKSARQCFFFLRKDGSVGYCEVTRVMVNCGARFGLEIPCV